MAAWRDYETPRDPLFAHFLVWLVVAFALGLGALVLYRLAFDVVARLAF